MVRYRRNFVTGGTYFFTATLVDRKSRVLIDHVEALRAAIRATRRAHPFIIDAIVVLPDHLHIVMTLPAGDADYSSCPQTGAEISGKIKAALVSGQPAPDFADAQSGLRLLRLLMLRLLMRS